MCGVLERRVPRRSVRFAPGVTVFVQGAQANSVFYLQHGGVKLSVLSSSGKEAVVAMLGPGDFFGEGCLAAQTVRMSTAAAVVATTVLRIPKGEMSRLLHQHPEFSDRFIAHMLARNIRIERTWSLSCFTSSENGSRDVVYAPRYGRDSLRARCPALAGQPRVYGGRRVAVTLHEQFPRLAFIEYNVTLKITTRC